MISQENLDRLKIYYSDISTVMELIEAYEALQVQLRVTDTMYQNAASDWAKAQRWSKTWKEAATLHRYRANNWLSLTLTYSKRLSQVEQWAKAWKRAAKKQRENFNRFYKVALATVETHETVKTYGEDATETNE